MKKSFFKSLAVLLAMLMLASAFVACADKPAEEQTTAAPEVSTDPAAEETTESKYDADGYLKDSIPETLKLNTTLRMLYWSDTENVEFFVEESSGDLVKDSIYTRNLRVEDRLAVTFDYVGTLGNYNNNAAYLTTVTNAAKADDIYDIYAAYSMTTANVAYNGYAKNLNEYEILDFNAPWWRANLIKEATFNGKLYFAAGDLSTNLLYMMYTFYFNKNLLDNYNLESPYDLVDNNTWTYEKMFEMASVVGTPASSEDTMGFVTNSSVHLDPFFWGAGLRVINKDVEGVLSVDESFMSEKTVEVAAKVQKFLHEAYCNTADSTKSFDNGRTLFTLHRARYASSNLSDAEFQFGVVPMPKYTADQENYVTCLGYPYTLYAISTTSKQPEAAAAALECLSSEGYRTITPALFEVSMKFKYTSDSQAGRMFDIIRETANFDIGRVFTTNLENVPYSLFRGNVNSETAVSISTQYKAYRKSFEKNVEKLGEVLAGLQ